METVRTIEEARAALRPVRAAARTVGLVPTMGALHEGHLSLVRAAREQCDVTVVSIFVNPTQFGEGEDLEAYPRDLDADAALLAEAGVGLVFAPSVEAMYPPGAATRVDPGPLRTVWCGATRPGHFVGVATVVTKLLNIVGPDAAFFGEKDFQQLRVIERVVADLDIATRIVGCPIVREPDGLALSSRNRYLTPEQRKHALVLWRALSAAKEQVERGETATLAVQDALAATISAEPGVALEYAAVVDSETLACPASISRECRAIVAARVGNARLIDNVALYPPGAPSPGVAH